MRTDPESFIRANTALGTPPHVPEIRLHLADEAHDLWLKTEEDLDALGLPPPFWAFAWAGGQGLARFLIDTPDLVAGKTVLDFASGSGLVAIAACLASAASVTAADIDPWAATAARLNAEANGVAFAFRQSDLIGADEGWDVVLAGDVFYDRAMTELVWPWLRALAHRGATVLAGDPGRAYCPKQGLEHLATYQVPVTRALEDSEIKRTSVWRVVS
ncbi:MAG: methyltransferase [Hoeflea sp.]|uniref:class I SAM-dependent methyltransferase n=1 Tax=Hoeflea sp. TaxID=1940281 RepID=UPI0027305A5F|nr:methyltransferase [Hoeflea sp.]MDP2121452.1 methyltransferase [Hoeflea sp.]MDZ7600696.1 methyltransferase [Hoeflea sp.]